MPLLLLRAIAPPSLFPIFPSCPGVPVWLTFSLCRPAIFPRCTNSFRLNHGAGFFFSRFLFFPCPSETRSSLFRAGRQVFPSDSGGCRTRKLDDLRGVSCFSQDLRAFLAGLEGFLPNAAAGCSLRPFYRHWVAMRFGTGFTTL